MHRTTVHLDADLEILVKLEARRQKKSMAQLLREVVRAHFADRPRRLPPGGGEFSSARGSGWQGALEPAPPVGPTPKPDSTVDMPMRVSGEPRDRAEELLEKHGFGRGSA
ncbi:MAG TPA: CopG family transcriptional regulator [Thermoanaerobaculia bacterium]|nr:CopG family transcriptional regulator [Thermoanaerobaculia bacterium]